MGILKTQPALHNEEAITAASDLFWQRGYEETAMEDIVQATGMNRYALYKNFGGKLEIFLAALDRYFVQHRTIFMDALSDPATPPSDAFKRVWTFSITQMVDRGNGCMMGNVAAEVAKHEPVVATQINQYLSEIECAHTLALQRAKDRGELNPMISPEAGAALLVTLMLGLGDQAKNGACQKDLLSIFENSMRLLMPKYHQPSDIASDHPGRTKQVPHGTN